MEPTSRQSIVTVTAGDLERAAAELAGRLAALPGSRVVALTSDVNRITSLRTKATIVAVVDHS